ncbi:hypothetical protein E4U61_001329 [Claviceps capensis]|nr:hypothetical protein E4U61_001329 [Claviceps capensis]
MQMQLAIGLQVARQLALGRLGEVGPIWILDSGDRETPPSAAPPHEADHESDNKGLQKLRYHSRSLVALARREGVKNMLQGGPLLNRSPVIIGCQQMPTAEIADIHESAKSGVV